FRRGRHGRLRLVERRQLGGRRPVALPRSEDLRTGMYHDLRLYIGGEWRDAGDGATRPVTDPATEETLGVIAAATEADIDAALAAAQRGFETWRRTGTWDRAKLIRRVAELVRSRAERIATLMSLETGKPIGEAMGEVGAA